MILRSTQHNLKLSLPLPTITQLRKNSESFEAFISERTDASRSAASTLKKQQEAKYV